MNINITEQQDIICKQIIQGKTLKSISREYNLDLEEIYLWLQARNYKKFQKRYERALLIRDNCLIDDLIDLRNSLIQCVDVNEAKNIQLQLNILKQIIRFKKYQNENTRSLDTIKIELEKESQEEYKEARIKRDEELTEIEEELKKLEEKNKYKKQQEIREDSRVPRIRAIECKEINQQKRTKTNKKNTKKLTKKEKEQEKEIEKLLESQYVKDMISQQKLQWWQTPRPKPTRTVIGVFGQPVKEVIPDREIKELLGLKE